MKLDVICAETEAFYQFVDEMIKYNQSQAPKPEDDWIDGEEAMSVLGIGTTTLQKYRDQNLIRVSRLSKKHLMYFRPSLIELLENNVQSY